MRKIIFAFVVLVAVAIQPLRAQQVSPVAPAPAPAATPPGPVYSNVAYGVAGGETLLLDVYEPANNVGKPRPAVVLVHGGGWTNFDKSTMRALAQFLALAGFVAVPVNYRLFHDDATRWPAQLDDVQRAVRWVRANCAKYNVDPLHVGAYGHDDATEFLSSFLGADFATHPEVWRDASPVFHVAKSNAPILIIHGTRDEMVPISQAEELNAALTKVGATVQFLRLDSDHMFHEPGPHRQLALETQAFFDRYLASAH